jgi:hypothetical protein
MTVKFKRFFRAIERVDELLEEAAQFAATIPPERLINITEGANGVVVWYWTDEADE